MINILILFLTKFLFKVEERNIIYDIYEDKHMSKWKDVCFDEEYLKKAKKALENYKF